MNRCFTHLTISYFEDFVGNIFIYRISYGRYFDFSLIHRRIDEDLQLFGIIMNQEIRRLSTQVIFFFYQVKIKFFLCGKVRTVCP